MNRLSFYAAVPLITLGPLAARPATAWLTIVIPASPTETEGHAAQELGAYLPRICGERVARALLGLEERIETTGALLNEDIFTAEVVAGL